MKRLYLVLLALLLLLPSCGDRGTQAGGKLVIQAPEQARVSETVVIKVTDGSGRPVVGAGVYSDNEVTGGAYIGETDKEGQIVTFFEHPVSYALTARQGKAGEPRFAEGKGTIDIVPGLVELAAYGGFHVGPPPLPSQPAQTNNYRPGMTVKLRMKNIGLSEITPSNSAPWKIQTSDDKVVFSPVALQVIIPLAPGESKGWTWDQKDNNGNQVKEGRYIVVLSCSEGEYRCWFNIVPEGLQ